MAITGLPNPIMKRERGPIVRRRAWAVGIGVILIMALMLGLRIVGENWPYRYRKIKPLLEDVFGSQVSIAHYHRTYFPHPGFMATGITLRRKSAPDQPPLGTVQALYVQGRWIDLLLLRQRVQLVDMSGAHVVLPPPGSRAATEDFPPGSSADFTGPDTAIGRLEVHNSVLDVLRDKGGRYSFPIEQLAFDNVEKGHTTSFTVDMENAIPSGHIHASGRFGPLVEHSLQDTLASGDFTFNRVSLHDVGNVSGTLASKGKFFGSLGALQAEAKSNTPDFAVDGGQPTAVSGSVRCTVNALNGDTVFHSIEVRVGQSVVLAKGSTAGSPEKTTNLDMAVKSGRVEDVMRPFLHQEVPITGPVSLHAHASLAPSSEGRFFHRLHVDGAFDVPAERVTDPKTEKSLTDFSYRAQDKKEPDAPKENSQPEPQADVLSSIAGPASIREEIVTTSGVRFQLPGAEANLKGTFVIHTRAVHLTGDLRMHSDISHAATGFKSLLLKPLAPCFRKHHAGAVIPIAVTGTPGKYKVDQDIGHDK